MHDTREQTGEPWPPELIETLDELLRGTGAAGLVSRDKLKGSRVHRIKVDTGRDVRSFIVKRFSNPNIAKRNQMVAKRWFPAAGLAHAVPHLLGIAAQRDGRRVWHIYEDVGDCTLVAGEAVRDRNRIFCVDPDRIAPAVALIAQIHARFAARPILAECRLYGDDFGSHFFVSAVNDAIRCLDALLALEHERRGGVDGSVVPAPAEDARAATQQPERIEALARFGGPETLLHGDLWPINVMVSSAGAGRRARLIDWDHAGVGPVTYDLSTFLTHFPPADRQRILDLYLCCMADSGIRFPPETDWNLLFDTAEHARLAITVAWDALSRAGSPGGLGL